MMPQKDLGELLKLYVTSLTSSTEDEQRISEEDGIRTLRAMDNGCESYCLAPPVYLKVLRNTTVPTYVLIIDD